ncbi:Uncharacterized protein APZ42_025841 [Daphnia magna]|uniref:Uncharacterized protein n=1 Tax=Daphnia magna TaxID=35525 RepID=A0A164SPX3_9CRUS|nr:Uncharacterized protein APZ42_025841 [Daphnia magna]
MGVFENGLGLFPDLSRHIQVSLVHASRVYTSACITAAHHEHTVACITAAHHERPYYHDHLDMAMLVGIPAPSTTQISNTHTTRSFRPGHACWHSSTSKVDN